MHPGRWALLFVGLSACGGSSKPSRTDCEAAAVRFSEHKRDFTNDRFGVAFEQEKRIASVKESCRAGWSREVVACVRESASWDEIVFDCGVFPKDQVDEHRAEKAEADRLAAIPKSAAPPDAAPPTTVTQAADGRFQIAFARATGVVQVTVRLPDGWVLEKDHVFPEFARAGETAFARPTLGVMPALTEPDARPMIDRANEYFYAFEDRIAAHARSAGDGIDVVRDDTLPAGRFQAILQRVAAYPDLGQMSSRCLLHLPTGPFAIEIRGTAGIVEKALPDAYRVMCETAEIRTP